MARNASEIKDRVLYLGVPDESGMFGEYGGRYVAETLIEPLAKLEQAYQQFKDDPEFIREYQACLLYTSPSPRDQA